MEDSPNKLFSNMIHHLTVPDNDIAVVMVEEVVNIDCHNDLLPIVGVIHQVADRNSVGLFVGVLGPCIDHMTFGHFVAGHRYIGDLISVGHH